MHRWIKLFGQIQRRAIILFLYNNENKNQRRLKIIMVTVTCSVCGKQFESLKSTKKYCSKECENTARRQRY